MKTQLLKTDRLAIGRAIVEHKFGPLEAALAAEEGGLAEEVRVRAVGDYLKTLERAPKGAYATVNSIRLTVSGQYHSLFFGGKYPNAVERRIFHSHLHSNALQILGSDPLGERVLDLVRRRRVLKDEKDGLSGQVGASLAGFRTFDNLLETWPEAGKFITERWRNRGGAPTNLPAVVLSKLSAALDLPPDDAAIPQTEAA